MDSIEEYILALNLIEDATPQVSLIAVAEIRKQIKYARSLLSRDDVYEAEIDFAIVSALRILAVEIEKETINE